MTSPNVMRTILYTLGQKWVILKILKVTPKVTTLRVYNCMHVNWCIIQWLWVRWGLRWLVQRWLLSQSPSTWCNHHGDQRPAAFSLPDRQLNLAPFPPGCGASLSQRFSSVFTPCISVLMWKWNCTQCCNKLAIVWVVNCMCAYTYMGGREGGWVGVIVDHVIAICWLGTHWIKANFYVDIFPSFGRWRSYIAALG